MKGLMVRCGTIGKKKKKNPNLHPNCSSVKLQVVVIIWAVIHPAPHAKEAMTLDCL